MLKKFPSLKNSDDNLSNETFLELSKVAEKYKAHRPIAPRKKEVSLFPPMVMSFFLQACLTLACMFILLLKLILWQFLRPFITIKAARSPKASQPVLQEVMPLL
jgi:hypothetical protein